MNSTIQAIAKSTNEQLGLDCLELRFLYEEYNSHNHFPWSPLTAHTYIYDRRKYTDTAKLGLGRVDYNETSATVVVPIGNLRSNVNVCFEYANPDFYPLLKAAILEFTAAMLK